MVTVSDSASARGAHATPLARGCDRGVASAGRVRLHQRPEDGRSSMTGSSPRGAHATPLAGTHTTPLARTVVMDRYWLLSSTFYGNWLPGDPRGFVSRVRDRRPD